MTINTPSIIYIFIFLFGSCVGSFLNVIAIRLPINKSFILPRSQCLNCHKKLNLLDLIPILSWISLSGKCRYCSRKLSLWYPIVEFITAISFCIISIGSINDDYIIFSELISGWILTSFLIVLTIIDIKEMILPNSLTFYGSCVGLILAIVNNSSINNFSNLIFMQYIYAYFVALLGFYIFCIVVQFILNKPAFGFGDAKLFAMSGAWLGLSGLEVVITLSFLIGGIFSLIGLSTRFIKRGDYIPFGPFICLSILLVWKLGSQFWFGFLGNIFWWKFIK